MLHIGDVLGRGVGDAASGDRIVFRFHNPGVVPGEGPQHRIVDVLWNP